MRVLLVSNDRVGSSMAGPAIRYWQLARELSRTFDVTLAVPAATDLVPEGFALVEAPPREAHRVSELALEADAVVAQQLPLETMALLAQSPVRTIFDLYAPVTIELIALVGRTNDAIPHALIRQVAAVQRAVLATGDAFVCASEKQRDLWLGALGVVGRLDPLRYRGDPGFRNLIDVVPYGVETEAPRRARVLKGVVPGIAESDRVLLWGGGIWNWFDPLTLIRAVAALESRIPNVRLYFLGTRHPNPDIGEMAMTNAAFELADALGVRNRLVFFNEGWVPYDERGAYLVEADLGVSAHFDDIETRFAFRTRLLDCLWAGLPVVATRGDALSEVLAACGAGRVVDFEDVAGWVEALDDLLSDPDARARATAAAESLRREYEWPVVAGALARVIERAEPGWPKPRIDHLVREDVLTRARLSLAYRGPIGAGAHFARLVAARAGIRKR